MSTEQKSVEFDYIMHAIQKTYIEDREGAKGALARYKSLLKDAAANCAPFWQPIAECPKQDLKPYLLVQHGLRLGSRVKTGTYNQAENCWLLSDGSTPYDGHDLTHFAELPPLPQQEI